MYILYENREFVTICIAGAIIPVQIQNHFTKTESIQKNAFIKSNDWVIFNN